jgi:hypothetical protein
MMTITNQVAKGLARGQTPLGGFSQARRMESIELDAERRQIDETLTEVCHSAAVGGQQQRMPSVAQRRVLRQSHNV